MIEQRKISRYVLLQIVTLGIYGTFKFWPKWTEDLNKICKNDGKDSAHYGLVFLLDIFSLGIYSFVWNYQTAERMYRIAPEYGIELKRGGSFVLMLRTILFFLPVFGSVERIKSFNALAIAYNEFNGEEPIVLEAMKDKKAKDKAKAKAKKEKKSKKSTNEADVAVAETIDEIPSPEVIEALKDGLYEATVQDVVAEEPAEVAVEEAQEEVVIDIPVEAASFEEASFEEVSFEEVPVADFVETTFKTEEVIDIPVVDSPVYDIPEELPVIDIEESPKAALSKEEILKNAAKSAGSTKRTAKEKVKDETEKKTTKSSKTTKTAEKSTKTTKSTSKAKSTKADDVKEEKETKKTTKKTTSKSTKETKPKTTKAAKEKAKKEVEKLADEVKIDDSILEAVSFDEINLEEELLKDIDKAKK